MFRLLSIGVMFATIHTGAWWSQTVAQRCRNSHVSRRKQYPPVRKGCVDYISGGLFPDEKLLAKPKPEYPDIAKSKGISGNVFVFVLTDTEGNVTSATIHSGPPLLQEAALEAAKQARFPPSKLSGVPIKIRVLLKYDFDLIRGTH